MYSRCDLSTRIYYTNIRYLIPDEVGLSKQMLLLYASLCKIIQEILEVVF